MKVGDWFMNNNRLVEILNVADNGRALATLIQNQAVDLCEPLLSGGLIGWHDPEHFRPVTDAVLLLRIELTKAMRDEKQALKEIEAAKLRRARMEYALRIATARPEDSNQDEAVAAGTGQ